MVEAQQIVSELDTQLGQWELRRLLAGPYDQNGARLTIQAGAGGFDAQDWAEELERMYNRFAEKQGWKVSLKDRSVGEENGVKSVEVEIEGRFVYGLLSPEKGTHRCVHMSKRSGKRETCFAAVEVMPVLDEAKVRPLGIARSCVRPGAQS